MKLSARVSRIFGASNLSSGFTLIELMVVISIIAILSTIALFGFGKAQSSARDANRQETMNGVRSALERYYAANQAYPTGNFGEMTTALKNLGFLSSLPVDPAAKTCTTTDPTTGAWFPCTGKDPIYVYDSSATAYNDSGSTCIGTGTIDVSGCKAGCSPAQSCYVLFLFSESTGAVTTFKSPQ